ncbi:MAG: FtsQ-type POTRA domain-containing protein [Clostridia bacterium]|nr:FtsQ-type POTRA domain-containing protein [Clostridia bacterium]
MDNLNDTQKNKERIKSGISSRRKSGERIRDLHKKSGRDASFPSVEPKFEMEAVLNQYSDPAGDAQTSARPEAAEGSKTTAKRGSDRKESSKHGKKARELNTSGVEDARGISHEQRRRRQTRRDLIKVLSILLCIVLLFAAAALIKRYTTVKTIGVSGSRLYSEDQILSLSGISIGRSIFKVDENELRGAIDSIPSIHVRSIRKVYPNRIEIQVEDVFARAFIPGANGKYTVISADGYVLSIVDEPEEGLLEVRGLASYGFSPGSYIDDSAHNIRTVGALKLIEAIDERGYSDLVHYIDLSGAVYTRLGLSYGYTAVLGAVTTAPDCIDIAISAYERFLPVYPDGGTINVFSGSSIVDFTPNLP